MQQRTPRVFRSLEDAAGKFGPCALTIGNFDGTHIGHQQIFARVSAVAAAQGWKAAALTFDPHPAQVVAPARAPKLLTSPDQRAKAMGRFGIDEVLILPFDRTIAALTPEEFASRVLVEALDVGAVLVGDNFHFGAKQAGNIDVLRELGKQHGFAVEIIQPVSFRGRMVSSSEVRRTLESGELNATGRLLGRWFALEGDVVSGHGIGSKQTVPTLNLAARSEILPGRGVYVTQCADLDSGRRWPAVTNVGYRPTFGAEDQLTIETFLLAPLGGETPNRIRVIFLRRLRDERKFENPAALKEQILMDVRRAQGYHRRLAKWVSAAACYTEM